MARRDGDRDERLGHGPMSFLAAIHLREAIRAILECLGLPSRAPPIAAAGLDPEADGIEHIDDPSYQ